MFQKALVADWPRILYPNRFLAFCDGNYIETQQGELALTMQLPPALRAEADTPLLAGPYTAQRAAIARVVAKPNFDDHSGLLVLHDQVELAAAAAVIATNEEQTLRQKKSKGGVFSLHAILQVFCFVLLRVR